MEESRKSWARLKFLVKITLVCANVAIFLGIGFGIFQYLQTERINDDQVNRANTFEKRKYSIEAINKFYNSDFLKSVAIIKSNNYDPKSKEYINASNLVFNTYYIISIIYLNEIADNKIIGKAIKNELELYTKSKDFNEEPAGIEKQNILQMLSDINPQKLSK